MKKVLFSICTLSALQVSAQVRIGRTSINCAGTSHVSNGILISQTAGQSSNVTVAKSREVMIRQGFQQPNWIKSEQLPSDFSVSLFPNPNMGVFTVELTGLYGDAIEEYRVVDTKGALVTSGNPRSETDFQVSMPTVAPGEYYLYVQSKQGKNATVKLSIY